ncbi:unnamed protein product [Rotaria sordida]|uniref:Uncharacterized protein n=1 Tax=Rotaria sordida TaxID=392033 RepID=A0A813YBD1_9BILA|nr:unnamed protein product [Rotaria sordida]CAF0943383.1 unnamed protein product [Rotaria sordida]CAF0943977.1 unnamed protein product [Rotaria sordida]
MPTFLTGLIIGGAYIHDCRDEPRLPVWSVVLGAIGVGTYLVIIGLVLVVIRRRHNETNSYRQLLITALGITIFSMLFILIWGIIGIIWTFNLIKSTNHQNESVIINCNQHALNYARGIPWFCITHPMSLELFFIEKKTLSAKLV